jgi:hypothetical protein
VVGRIHPADAAALARIDDDVRDAVDGNPFLGAAWHPLVALLAEATDATEAGAFWRLEVVRLVGDAPGPFVQAARVDDGSLRVEVCGHLVLDGPDSRRRAELPVFGFSEADAGDPLPHRTFAADTAARKVAATVLEVLAVVYDLEAGDFFTLAGTARGRGDDPRFGFAKAGDDVFRLGAR